MSVNSDPRTMIEPFEPVLKTEISFTDYESKNSHDWETESKTSEGSRTKSAEQKNTLPVYSGINEQLYAAAEKGDVAEVKAIIKKSSTEQPLKSLGHTRSPMIAACSNGQRAVVEELLKAGFEVNIANETGRTCLHQACLGGHFKVVELLVDYTDQLDMADRDGFTAAHVAALNGEVRCLQTLYDKGASMDLMDKEGRQLAHLAAMRNHHNVLEFLYENGFELQCPDNRKRLPIHFAAKHGATGCLASLVERDCDVILPDNSGCLAIHYAASNNRLDCVRFLVVQGTDLDITQSQGKTPVHLAAEHGAISVLHWLLEKGAKTNVQDACGNTALHGSAAAGRGAAYNCLLSHGADTALVNEKGDTSFDIAKKHGHPILIQNATSGVERCPHCFTKEKHDNWHLAHPVPRVTKELTALADRAYTAPVGLLRASSQGTATQRTKQPASRCMTKNNVQVKAKKTTKDNAAQQLPTRSLAARYFGDHVND